MATSKETLDLNPLFEQQNDLYSIISRVVDNTKKVGKANWTISNLKSRLDRLEVSWNEFYVNHKKLISFKGAFSETVYFSDDLFAVCEEAYITAKTFLLDLLRPLKGSTSSGSVRSVQSAQLPILNPLTDVSVPPNPEARGFLHSYSRSRQLPALKLPSFDGNYSNWPEFRDLFYSMVNSNEEISNVEKFQYLKLSVINEPAQLIKNLLVTNDNFHRAWSLLVERYENRRVMIDTQLTLLLSARSIKTESATELKRLISEVKEAVGALEALGCPIQQWDYILVYLLVRKLDAETAKDWEKSISSYRDPSSFEEFEEFIIRRIYTLEAIEKLPSTSHHKKSSQPIHKPINFKSHNAMTSSFSCSLCGGAHYIASCSDFLSRNSQQRVEFVISKGLCFNCLGLHMLKKCRVTKRCRFCQKAHHSMLHGSPPEKRPFSTKDIVSKSTTKNDSSVSANPIPSTSHFGHAQHFRVSILLATALLRIILPRGDSILIRALIDQGSEVSFIGENLVQRLSLKRRSANIPIAGIGSHRTCISNGVVSVQLSSRLNPHITFNEEALVLPKLTSYLPQRSCMDLPSELNDLILADPEYKSERQIDLILGVQFYSKIIQGGIKKSNDNLLTAQQTSLGWILSGAFSNQSDNNSNSYGFQCSIDREFLDLMERFWRQEDDSVNVVRLSVDEHECEEHFKKTHSRESNGRFVVRLPFRKSPTELGASRSLAVQSFKRMELRFAKNEQLRTEYSQFMREYLSLGHMQETTDNLDIPNYYLPHHGVIRETSSTTRLRVVFNGSQPTSSGISLNHCLYIGPKLQTELVDVLIRWRRHPVVFACDIEKMYRQIKIHDEDLPFQRIVWRENDQQKLQTYELSTVTYGLSCAPFLAIRCIHELANENSSRQPLGALTLLRDTYVDDILSGANDVDEVQELIFQLNRVLTAGGFNARKWTSNYSEALTYISSDLIEKTNNLDIDDDNSPRALGLIWNNVDDHFLFSLENIRESSIKITKRSILSFIARLFDPLGWLSPLIITAKIIMQELWTLKLDWDESLPDNLEKKWVSFVNEFLGVPTIRVPRWLGIDKTATSIELHGFSDASNSAYGAVVYLRVSKPGEVKVSIVISKTKVAPLKSVTIPRLELCAAVLLVRLVKRVISVLDFQNIPVQLWSDSTVALSWICSHPSKWKDYVRNRTIEIQQLSQARWSYVSSQDNPADLSSRGVFIRQLQNENLWWSGPSWLSLQSSNWPSHRHSTTPEADQERRTNQTVHTAYLTNDWDLKNKYSNLNQLLRITAWCFRIFSKTKNQFVKDILSPDELGHALMFWIRECQQLHFGDEIRTLREGLLIQKSSSLYRLIPFLDGKGILRVTGRLRFALLDWDEKHPIILPKESRLTTLVIDKYHRSTLHGGTQLTISSIRRCFWILRGRVPVRAFIQRCMICARHRVEASQQLMGQLPSSRVTPSRPFFHTGVDYAGPFHLRTFRGRGGKTYKAYLVLFVCLATSAIHLEIATDYSTAGFLAAYKRFSGRRGLCECLYSDCGTNLVVADRELRSMFSAASKEWRHMANILSGDGTQWKFNPPASPHFGGKWEAGVRSVKMHLKKIVGAALLTYEEFSTILVQIEAVLNSRPLCAISEDPNNYNVLTPAHFLIGSALNVVPGPSLLDEKVSRLTRWQLLTKMVEEFWKKWESYYLQSIQNSTKWFEKRNIPEIGSLVLVKDERLPPSKWLMARVQELHPGSDGHVRIVTIKTPTTTLVRPITKICVLPLQN